MMATARRDKTQKLPIQRVCMYVCMYVCVHVVSPSSTTEYMMYSSYDKKHKEGKKKENKRKIPTPDFILHPD